MEPSIFNDPLILNHGCESMYKYLINTYYIPRILSAQKRDDHILTPQSSLTGQPILCHFSLHFLAFVIKVTDK
jgi:hypothetical protein